MLSNTAAPQAGATPARQGAAIRIDRVTKAFGSVLAVDDVTLDVAAGEFIALLGPSGSGKTSILMSIAGFDFPSRGRVLIDERDVTFLPANQRNLGMVFQKYTLFPHLSVRDNVAFPLKMRGVGKKERARRAEAALETVRLSGFGDRMPAQLSGGQQQRVALARAIVYEPRVLLMDEPLSALDKNLREEMQLEIKRIHGELGVTVLFVTHDQSEALRMADRIAVLREGKIQQLGTPAELYEKPANLFVASFMGEMNFLPATFTADAPDGQAEFTLAQGTVWRLPKDNVCAELAPGARVSVACRPEQLTLASAAAPDTIAATVTDVVFSGPSCLVLARTAQQTELRVWQVAGNHQTQPHVGDAIHIAPNTIGIRAYAEAAS